MRFFFDFVTQSQVIYDYAGAEFSNPEHALDFAEATRQDLKNSANGEWRGWSVKVRDAECKTFFSLPVDPTFQDSIEDKAAA
jgi:hypothetical protein